MCGNNMNISTLCFLYKNNEEIYSAHYIYIYIHKIFFQKLCMSITMIAIATQQVVSSDFLFQIGNITLFIKFFPYFYYYYYYANYNIVSYILIT